MGSVPAVNAGLSDLLQTLSNVNSPVLSSKAAVSALESAPPSDIVQLSEAAIQLEGVDAIFGVANTPGSDMFGALTSLENPSAIPSVLSNASPSDQLANYEAALQAELAQGLFAPGTSTSITGSLFNSLG